jgi:mRNA interferase MazF
MFDRGSIYLAKLYPSKGAEPGKTRPVLILQSNMLNHIEHPTTIVVPLTTQLIDNTFPLRFRLSKRHDLQQNSDLLCDQVRAIDIRRLLPEKIASLTTQEMLAVEQQVELILKY